MHNITVLLEMWGIPTTSIYRTVSKRSLRSKLIKEHSRNTVSNRARLCVAGKSRYQNGGAWPAGHSERGSLTLPVSDDRQRGASIDSKL